MVFEDANRWYSDDGGLSKTFCEQTEQDVKFDENDCCACDEAKYSVRTFNLRSHVLLFQLIPIYRWYSKVFGQTKHIQEIFRFLYG